MLRKDKINVLISSAGRNYSLVRYFKKAVGGKGTIVAIDINKYSSSFFAADYAYTVPPYTDTSFIESLTEICTKHNINLLIPGSDEEILIFAKNKEKFDSLGILVMVSNLNSVNICSDKLMFANFCKNNGFKTAKLIDTKDINKNYKFPVFINSRFGKGSKSAFIVESYEQYKLLMKTVWYPIIQECIDTEEYTVDLFADFGARVISVVPRRRIQTMSGESMVGITVFNKLLIDKTKQLSQKLGLVGHITIQCFFNGKTVNFIEINPRFGGGSSLAFEAGCNSPEFLVSLLKGEKIKYNKHKFRNNLIMTRYIESIFYEEKKGK